MDWNLVLGIVSIAMNVLLGIGLAYIASKQGEIKDLKAQLESAIKERVDQRFQGVDREIESINQRLSDGDESFEKIAERNQRIELAVSSRMAETREWMIRTFVTKDDLKTFVQAIHHSNTN